MVIPNNFGRKIRRMKKVLLSLTMTIIAIIAWSQDKNSEVITSGRITYEENIKLDIKLEGEAAQFADMLPKERKTEKILSFTNEVTLFEEGKAAGEDMHVESGEGMVFRVAVSEDNKTFTDLKKNIVIEQRDFMNRVFIIEKPQPETKWKVTGNQKIILGYQCMEAITLDTAGVETVVWFAPSITIKGGPAQFSNLPGMVLEVDINDGKRTYVAKALEPVAATDLKLEKPRDGKKVTEEEYMMIVEEKMKEMGAESGHPGAAGGAHVRVIVRN